MIVVCYCMYIVHKLIALYASRDLGSRLIYYASNANEIGRIQHFSQKKRVITVLEGKTNIKFF